MGLFSMLLQNQQGQNGGMTYPGAGRPNTQIAPPGGPVLPQPNPGQAGGANIPSMTPPTPPGGSQPGGSYFSSLLNNPALMAMIKGGQASPAGVASGAAGIGPAGQFGGMSGADANTMRSQMQGGAPGTEMISPEMMKVINGGGQNDWLQNILAMLRGGGAAG